MVDGADLFKKINKLDKDITEAKRSFDVKMYVNYKEIMGKLTLYEEKSSRLEKLVLLLAVIQTVTIIILGVQ